MVFLCGSGPGGLEFPDSRKWKGLLLRGNPQLESQTTTLPLGDILPQTYPPTAPVRATTHHASDVKQKSGRWTGKV